MAKKKSTRKKSAKVVEFEDMTKEQQRIVTASETIAGTFPADSTRDEMGDWLTQRFMEQK